MMTDKQVYIHPKAIVETKNIGEKTRIWAFVHILGGATIGKNCNICDHCLIENDVVIGDNVTVKSGVYIWDGVTVEDNVFLGPNVVFTNDVYPRSKAYQKDYPRILIKEGASVGAGSVLIAGITIGKYALVGGGAVVTKDIKDYQLVYGNPAKSCGYICGCKEKFNFKDGNSLKCKCGLSYQLKNGVVSKI